MISIKYTYKLLKETTHQLFIVNVILNHLKYEVTEYNLTLKIDYFLNYSRI